MRGIKGMDFFQKISMDNVTQPTLIGSFLSIFAICLMIFLFLRDVIDFFTTKTKTEAVVIQDKNQYEKIPLHLELNLPYLPCNLVSLDQEDTLRNHRLDISDTIKKYKIKKGNHRELYEKNKNNFDSLIEGISNNEGCLVQGYVEITKVPGNIHLSFHAYGNEWGNLKMKRRDLANKISVNHKFFNFLFGKVGLKHISRYRIGSRGFFRMNDLPDFKNLKNKNNNFDYFIKIIPYQLIDENKGSESYSYEYSISYKESPFVEERDDMPIILIRYEFTPITMRVTILKRNYLHFLTHVCAIVGGVFVIFSLLNKIIVGMFDFSNQISQQ